MIMMTDDIIGVGILTIVFIFLYLSIPEDKSNKDIDEFLDELDRDYYKLKNIKRKRKTKLFKKFPKYLKR